MPLPPLATVADLAAWTGEPVGDVERAEAVLSAASTLVRTHTGRVWVDAAGVPEPGISEVKFDAVRHVTVIVADRVYTNPRGYTQQTTGPFSTSVAAWSAYGLALTAEEQSMIAASTGGIPGLSSARVVAPAAAGYRQTDWDDDDETTL